MFCEFFTGSDSFPMGGRNVQFSTLVYNPRTALFENPRYLTESDDPVCRDVKIVQGIPASFITQLPNSQMWYHSRCECKSASLWLFEARVRRPGSVFGYDTSVLLLRLAPTAPALRAVYHLPRQEEANIHQIEMTLNAYRITDASNLTPDERNAFKKFVGESRDLVVQVTQSDEELRDWTFTSLEPAAKKPVSVLRSKNKPVAVQRVRRIRK